MKHPTKAGWTRVLYSTNVKLFPWIPNIIVNFITSKALVESTTWVKKESEAEALKQQKGMLPRTLKLAVMLPLVVLCYSDISFHLLPYYSTLFADFSLCVFSLQ